MIIFHAGKPEYRISKKKNNDFGEKMKKKRLREVRLPKRRTCRVSII